MPKPDPNAIAAPMIAAVKAYVASSIAALLPRITSIEEMLAKTPPVGERGEPGPPGPQGERGEPGAHGQAGDAGASGPRGEKGERGEPGVAGRDGKDGRDGRDGADGTPGRDALDLEILPGIDETKTYPRGTFAEHRGGVILAVRNTDPMEAGELARAGWTVVMNGIAEETEETLDDGRTIARRTIYTDGRVFERKVMTALLIYRGVWREGQHERGDVTTWAGSAWHCQEATTEKPGTSSAWKLMVKSGRDGRDAGAPAASSSPAIARLR